MLKVENYKEPERQWNVWKITISDHFIEQLDFTSHEWYILNECRKPEAEISMVVLGLALLAKKIESKFSNTSTGQEENLLPRT
jgi:hypothetical protein